MDCSNLKSILPLGIEFQTRVKFRIQDFKILHFIRFDILISHSAGMIRELLWRDLDDLVSNYYSFYGEKDTDNPDMGIVFLHRKPEMSAEIDWFSNLYRDVIDKNAVAVVAEEDGKAVGLCDVHRMRPGSEVAHIGILGIAIHRDYRGHGIGRAMMESILEKCRDEFDMILLSVFTNNEKAISLYRKVGFVQYGMLPGSVKRGSRYYDGYEMYYRY